MIRNEPKRTIFASSGLGLLQMVSESDTKQCTSEDAGCEISYQLERGTKHSL